MADISNKRIECDDTLPLTRSYGDNYGLKYAYSKWNIFSPVDKSTTCVSSYQISIVCSFITTIPEILEKK